MVEPLPPDNLFNKELKAQNEIPSAMQENELRTLCTRLRFPVLAALIRLTATGRPSKVASNTSEKPPKADGSVANSSNVG